MKYIDTKKNKAFTPEYVISLATHDDYVSIKSIFEEILSQKEVIDKVYILGNMIEGVSIIARRFGIFDFTLLKKILAKIDFDDRYINEKVVDLIDDFNVYFKINIIEYSK